MEKNTSNLDLETFQLSIKGKDASPSSVSWHYANHRSYSRFYLPLSILTRTVFHFPYAIPKVPRRRVLGEEIAPI